MVTDDQTSGNCLCCRKRDARQGYCCDACRSKLRGWLGEIPDLWCQLLDEPLARTGGNAKGGPVSGSRERQLPIRVDLFDLTHYGSGERVEGEDQVGHLAVWMTLESWMADWADWRGKGEAGVSGIPEMCGWLRERTDDACDAHPAIDEFYDAIRQLRGAMMAQLGQVDVPDYKRGVPCKNPECNALALVRQNGSDYVECGECPAVLTPGEFDNWVRLVAAAVKKMEKVA